MNHYENRQLFIVLTVDQRDSRRGQDLIPQAEEQLAGSNYLRPVERTAGDEFQVLINRPESLMTSLDVLLRQDQWNIGIGIGPIEHPVPQSTRAGRGPAYLRAREAVTAAKKTPTKIRVVGDEGQGAYRLETVLWLWAGVLARRTEGGWAVADLMRDGLKQDEVARQLLISRSAVSQRAQAAGVVEGTRARELALYMTDSLMKGRHT